MNPNITALQMVLFVPTEIASSIETAGARAGIFATLALWVGTPIVESVDIVPGGYRVTLREASDATAKAKRK